MRILDLRGTIIPFSLLEISNVCKQMQPGETFEVIGEDSGIIAELSRILPEPDFRLSKTDLPNPCDHGVRIRIYKSSLHQHST